LAALAPGEIRPGALLTPQGKILFDFLISRVEDGFRLDCPAEAIEDFRKRLTLYRLRAKIDFSIEDQVPVYVSWESDSGGLIDRRFPETLDVRRHYGPMDATATMADWELLRIRNGVAEGGADFALGTAFPHDVLFDQNGGVGLRKGCFVGQEVVSRMQHRGTARRRVVIVEGTGDLPPAGTEITAGGRAIGTLGTV